MSVHTELQIEPMNQSELIEQLKRSSALIDFVFDLPTELDKIEKQRKDDGSIISTRKSFMSTKSTRSTRSNQSVEYNPDTCAYTKLDIREYILHYLDTLYSSLSPQKQEFYSSDIERKARLLQPLPLHDKFEKITFATEWIYWSKSYYFPFPLSLDVSLSNEYGYTIAQWIIKYLHKDPPPEFHHDPLLMNYDGNTAFMLWIIHVRSVPPDWMLHDLTIKNEMNISPVSLWFHYCVQSFPASLIEKFKWSFPKNNIITRESKEYTLTRSHYKLEKALSKQSQPSENVQHLLENTKLPMQEGGGLLAFDEDEKDKFFQSIHYIPPHTTLNKSYHMHMVKHYALTRQQSIDSQSDFDNLSGGELHTKNKYEQSTYGISFHRLQPIPTTVEQILYFCKMHPITFAKVAYKFYSEWTESYRLPLIEEETFHVFMRFFTNINIDKNNFLVYVVKNEYSSINIKEN